MTTPTPDRARWNVHGDRPDTLCLVESIEDGPLAEITCAGAIDPAVVVDALNAHDALAAEVAALRTEIANRADGIEDRIVAIEQARQP